jgi:hypothetical protein
MSLRRKVEINTDYIDSAAGELEAVQARLQAISSSFNSLPDPVQASGNGHDDLSKGFRVGWGQMKGETTVDLESPARRVGELVQQLRDASALFKSADEAATRDALAARGVVERDVSG